MLQLASSKVACLWRVSQLERLPLMLSRLLQDRQVHKVSQGATHEITALKEQFGISPQVGLCKAVWGRGGARKLEETLRNARKRVVFHGFPWIFLGFPMVFLAPKASQGVDLLSALTHVPSPSSTCTRSRCTCAPRRGRCRASWRSSCRRGSTRSSGSATGSRAP